MGFMLISSGYYEIDCFADKNIRRKKTNYYYDAIEKST